jgi:hypothetical protein
MLKFNAKLLAAVVVAGAAASANAGLTYSVTRTADFYGSYDLLTFQVTGWTGVDNNGATYNINNDPNGLASVPNGITGISGTFSGATGTSLYVPGTTAVWPGKTLNGAFVGSEAPVSGFSTSQGSFINFDSKVGNFTRTTSGTTTSAFTGAWFTAVQSQDIRPVDVTVGANDDGLDNTSLAYILVSHGGNVTFTGQVNTLAIPGGYQATLTTAAAGPTFAVGAVTTPTTTITGNNVSYKAAVLGSNGSFTMGGTPAGNILVALDLSGQTSYTNFFGSSLPAGDTDVSAQYASLFTSLLGGSYDVVISIPATQSGTVSIGGLPAGVTLNSIAVVPEPTSLAGLALLGVPALARRRRA